MRDPLSDSGVVERLAALATLADLPRTELEWLAANGRLESHGAGAVVARGGEPIDELWVVLSGCVAVRVDRGAGQRLVMRWRVGEVSGMLPYSRMSGPPGDNYAEEATELLVIHEDRFAEMVHRCPSFTTYTVHLMLDRARSFNTSDMQDERMVALGRLSAGLAHELNNPASAIVRGAKLLHQLLAESAEAVRSLGVGGEADDVLAVIARARGSAGPTSSGVAESPLARADREHDIAEWLERAHCDPSHSAALAEGAVSIGALDELAERASPERLDALVRWMSTGITVQSLARDIELAGTRIHDLVGAVKRFSYMDRAAGLEPVDVGAGLSDTIEVLAAKARSKDATISLELEERLPPVRANGAELNQVWMSLLDNALDAISPSGRIEVAGRAVLDRVVIEVVDDGPGIPADVLPRVFDPFFTTKAPGEGTGLGLEIARRLVRRFDGDISVRSRPGRTEFDVSLVAERVPR